MPGGLAGAELEWDERWAVTRRARLAPATRRRRRTGDVITRARRGRRPASRSRTRAPRGRDGEIVTAGGRVLNVTALGDGPAAARDAAYAAADLITFEGRQLRRDIALRAVERTA